MIATISFARSHGPPVLSVSPFLIVFVLCYSSFHLFTLTLAQSSQLLTTPTTPTTTNSSGQYPVTTTTSIYSTIKPTTTTTTITTPLSAAITTATTTTTTTTPILATTTVTTISATGVTNSSQQLQQPKSLKFTLCAGKFWKFNIKPNSFSTKEGELRLHKNVSAHNYIIDDEGWFQYNPQQQQLFAWPNLSIKPGTYLFVLLPSGIDFEADSENDLANPEVVANIVVELIRPVYIGPKSDIDLLIDHKFSLDFLHRHQSYPLLLQQIVAVLNTIAQTNETSNQQAHSQSDFSSLANLIAQQKSIKAAKRLGEYLLVSSNYSPDGEYFSLTWSTHPSLVNNTISQLTECRTTAILDVVTKLSTPSAGYQKKRDEYIVYYPLEAPIINSQAIVPTDRGSRALKVTLNGPCQTEKTVEQLGVVFESNKEDTTPVVDSDDKENNIVDQPQTSKNVPTPTPSSSSPIEAIESGTASKFTTSGSITTTASTSTISSSANSLEASMLTSLDDISSTNNSTTQNHLMLNKTTDESALVTTNATELPTLITSTVTTATATQVNRVDANFEAQVSKTQVIPVSQQQQQQLTKMQPQAKSFAGFLDSSDIQQINNSNTMTSTVPTPKLSHNTTTTQNEPTNPTVTAISASSNLLVTSTPNLDVNITSETSLNEDLIGILDDIVNYLTSVAIPVAIIVGLILLISIFIALCSLYMKRRKTKHFQVRNRFDFKYGSERRGFLKNSSKPVILDADHKSLSNNSSPTNYFPLSTIPNDGAGAIIADACGIEGAVQKTGDYSDSGAFVDS